MINPQPIEQSTTEVQSTVSEAMPTHATSSDTTTEPQISEPQEALGPNAAVQINSGSMSSQAPESQTTPRQRRWRFQPHIHINIANHKLAVTFNKNTGFLESSQELKLSREELKVFLDAISDKSLNDLQETIDMFSHFTPVAHYMVSSFQFSKTGDIGFNLAVRSRDQHSQEAKDSIIPGLSFDRIEFNLKRDCASTTE